MGVIADGDAVHLEIRQLQVDTGRLLERSKRRGYRAVTFSGFADLVAVHMPEQQRRGCDGARARRNMKLIDGPRTSLADIGVHDDRFDIAVVHVLLTIC